MPFKSDKNNGMIKKSVTNAFSKNGSLQDYARMRSGGMIKNGSKTPGDVVEFEQQSLEKFRKN
tara:strand:+ start:1391 stop:1579 length:189 start_codon:yes stop_codon:yes gene_type:complete